MTNAFEIQGDRIIVHFEPKEEYFFAPRDFAQEGRETLGCRSCMGEEMLTLLSTVGLTSTFSCRFLTLSAQAKKPVCETRLKK